MLETLEQAIAYYAKAYKVTESEAKADAERVISKMMEKTHCNRDFAVATFIEETEEMDSTELDEIDKKAKINGVAKVKGHKVDAYGKKTTRVRKENPTKRTVVKAVYEAIFQITENAQIVNPEKAIDFVLDGVSYTVSLTAHRPPKKKE